MDQQQKTVLIVDDDQAILEVMSIILTDEGYNVIQFESSDNILKKVEELMPNVILLDIWIAGMDGEKVANILKNHNRTKDIPIIMISAHASGKKIAQSSQVEDFLAKPFEVDELINKVRKFAYVTD